ncbi:SAM-dependent methyltransferase [Bacillus sp. 3255]|uniref:SAM-dependent methyltransferase n=1 Tax=Bacillus sp. 3255 TaxID=2817904 RepID=UPI002855FCDB|nr:SAM-dependent methyltransferase [Bacillus sp. 3255]MDR6879704.1 hypothetical protein [Bacillus sp. 3255]
MSSIDTKLYRFSESPIWELQRAYYEEQGIQAWQQHEVPQYITSNPVIAAVYAEMIYGFLQDRSRLGCVSEPVTIVELGAGSGLLAYHILHELCAMMDYAGVELPSFRYVMTDLAEANTAYWRQHPSLQPYVRRGILDFARFDAEQDAELHLLESGMAIRHGDLKQPLVVIANYFFDSIPQELIYVENNHMYDCMVSLSLSEETEEPIGSELLSRIVPTFQYRLADEMRHKDHPYHPIMELYASQLEDSHILFPTVGLQCLERLHRLSAEGAVILTGDKGEHTLESWAYNDPPELIHHGSFSLTANYHAIRFHLEQSGALCLFTSHPYHHLNVGCLLHVAEPHMYGNTKLAFRRFVERYGPDDYITIKEWLDGYLEQLQIPQFLAFWRLTGYDAQFFMQCAEHIAEQLLPGEEWRWESLSQGITCMWNGYYPLTSRHELALASASLLYRMDKYREALDYFEQTDEAYDTNAEVQYEMAICYYEIGELESARHHADRTVALASGHQGALSLLELM